MNPALTWIDLTTKDREKMRRVLDAFDEQGTVDEMGLGTIRDTLSDALFPGTSTLMTRLRYSLFIPWIYQHLEQKHVSSAEVEQMAKQAEIELIDSLLNSDDTSGVIGKRARWGLSQLPSQAYWSGLVHWDIFVPDRSQSWYHTHFESLSRGTGDIARADDPGVVHTRQSSWHRRLPPIPEDFPQVASFKLKDDEAGFLQWRFETSCSGSLLSWLAREGSSSPAEAFWQDPEALRAPHTIREVVELARRFSLHVEGLSLLYNLLLAERSVEEFNTHHKRFDEYRAELARWADEEGAEAPFEPSALWDFMAQLGGKVPNPQRLFVENWSSRVAEIGSENVADDDYLRDLVEKRELELKNPHRARLANLDRLREWRGSTGAGRMNFRWNRVRQLMTDLHRGLAA